jgi:Cys-tRNA(Pro)/Cys-tRNA(Cys) deacylase
MTPAIAQARAAGIQFKLHEVPARGSGHGAESGSAVEALATLGLPVERIFKTLVAKLDDAAMVVVVVPLSCHLDLKRLASAAGARRATMADAKEAERGTGYRLGAISPLGQRRRMPLFIDESAFTVPTICVSGGRRGLEIELPAAALRDLCGGRAANLAGAAAPSRQR